MNTNKLLELKAQIRILNFLLDHLCLGELPSAGRVAVKKLIYNLTKETNDVNLIESSTGSSRHNRSR